MILLHPTLILMSFKLCFQARSCLTDTSIALNFIGFSHEILVFFVLFINFVSFTTRFGNYEYINGQNTSSASGNSVVLFVPLLLGGIMLCIGRGVGGTMEKMFHYSLCVYIEQYSNQHILCWTPLWTLCKTVGALPIDRIGHFKSVVGGDKS